MNKIFSTLGLAAALLVAAPVLAADGGKTKKTVAPQAAEKLTVDAAASKVAWFATKVTGKHNGKPFRMTAERVFVAGGAVFTPFLLLKSGINHLRAIGRHLTIHPSTRAYYLFDEPVHASKGAFQSFAVHQFRDEGIHIISLFPPPGAFAATLPGIGPDLRLMMEQLPNMGIMGGLISDESEGRVLAAPFIETPIVSYNMTPNDKRKLIRT